MVQGLSVVRILLYSSCAICYTLIAGLFLRDYRKRKSQWGGTPYVCLALVNAFIYSYNVATSVLPIPELRFAELTQATCIFLVPPLLLHLFYHNEKKHLPASRVWTIWLGLVYSASLVRILAAVARQAGLLGYDARRFSNISSYFLVCAALSSAAIMLCSKRPLLGRERRQRWWLLLLCCSVAWTWILQVLRPREWNFLIGNILPLALLLIVTYYAERFTFFDVLIKKGVFAYGSLALLIVYFGVLTPWILRHREPGNLWPLSIWPVILLFPWFSRQLSSWLDRRWLGRSFSPTQATRYFLTGMQGVIDEDQLVRMAVERLHKIFCSKVDIVFASDGAFHLHEEQGMTASIAASGETIGHIRVSPREHGVRFLSEDQELLASLADGLAYLIENLRLREIHLQQERREQDLLLRANRSELRALRAQINPHFLFNALNTVAGLIPDRPDRAEETIEELAEVFRYTLHRSEREWVRLDEELEAVRSYLHIEQARFGESLTFSIQTSPCSEAIRIPAMIISTLVENAVKHGVSSLTTPGVVEVRVVVNNSRLRIEVRDNGVGFQNAASSEMEQGESGYGLRNIRERLRAYFGIAATLYIGRDTKKEMTLVSVEMPQHTAAVATEGL
jgi:anti-sigma regulatory factor (Ser/Thr protein kinase)